MRSNGTQSSPSSTTSKDFNAPLPEMSQTGNNEIPRFVQYTSPVSTSMPSDSHSATTLPLNLVALIISYLDDIGDIARVTRTCRLLYYMTLPQLYKKVALHSYADIRYVNGRPEGYGSGSPFTMALNGLVTKNHAALVQDFRLWGQWKESGIDEFAKGRVPDNTMMLNILLRAATDKMTKLQTFAWLLDCKPLKTLYQGLSAHDTLTSFTLRCPSTRVPRPAVLIPPMPNLRAFKVLDIDPMCYPDDISLLLLGSKKLEDVRLHCSPRMRREAECTLTLDTFFNRCYKANYKLPLKHFALQNFFGPNPGDTIAIAFLDTTSCESICILDTFGGVGSDPRTVFVDDTWKNLPVENMSNARRVRINDLAPQHVDIMTKAGKKVECLYIVSARGPKTCNSTDGERASASPLTPKDTPVHDAEIAALGERYIYAITHFHGESMRHLLLSDQWALTAKNMRDLFRHCPNLEQLGLALDTADHDTVRLLAPFIPKMRALRLLHNEHLVEHLRSRSHEVRMEMLGYDLAAMPTHKMKFLALGEHIYEAGNIVEVTKEDGTKAMWREIFKVGLEAVAHIEIWAMDTLDISADPIAPFS